MATLTKTSKQAVLILLLLGFSISGAQANTDPLVLLNWADYMDPEILLEFKKQTGIEVKELYYDSDEGRDEVMTSSEGKGIDLMVLSGLSIDNYQKQGWLDPIKPLSLDNYKHLDQRWVQAFPSSKEFSIPYFWGTLGIAYRKDLIKSPITSWLDILKPQDSLKGKITMMDSARELVGVSLKALGYSINSHNKKKFSEALQLMQSQSKFVNSYTYVDLDESSSLISGKSIAAMMYSGDALMLQELNDNIEYILPKEGSNIWVDYFAVSQQSKNKSKAWEFINFISQPKIAAKLAEYVYYAPPNKSAKKLLSEEFLSNQTIFPDKSTLKHSEFFKPLPARLLKKMTLSFQQISD